MSSTENVKKDNQIGKVRNFFKLIMSFRETNIVLIIFVASIAISLLSPYFLTSNNIRTTLIGLSADGMIAVGMTIALVSGGFDLSVGAVMALSGVVGGI